MTTPENPDSPVSAREPRRIAFEDHISGLPCELVIPVGGRLYHPPKIGIQHPLCDVLADVTVGLDAFYCPKCGWNGRVSGAWCIDMIEETYEERR